MHHRLFITLHCRSHQRNGLPTVGMMFCVYHNVSSAFSELSFLQQAALESVESMESGDTEAGSVQLRYHSVRATLFFLLSFFCFSFFARCSEHEGTFPPPSLFYPNRATDGGLSLYLGILDQCAAYRREYS